MLCNSELMPSSCALIQCDLVRYHKRQKIKKKKEEGIFKFRFVHNHSQKNYKMQKEAKQWIPQ